MTCGATDVLTIQFKKKIVEREECIRCQSTEQCWTKSTGLGVQVGSARKVLTEKLMFQLSFE